MTRNKSLLKVRRRLERLVSPEKLKGYNKKILKNPYIKTGKRQSQTNFQDTLPRLVNGRLCKGWRRFPD